MAATAIPAMTQSGTPVLILKEGSNQSRGKEAQRNNISAAKLIAKHCLRSEAEREEHVDRALLHAYDLDAELPHPPAQGLNQGVAGHVTAEPAAPMFDRHDEPEIPDMT